MDEGIVLSTYTNLVNDLRQCEGLEQLELTLCSTILHPDEPLGGPLSFPYLRKFCVIVDPERDPRPFLAALHLPNLKDLEIRRYKANFFSALLHADYLEPLILPNTPRLHSLTLGYFAVTAADVYEGVLGSPPINLYRLPDLLRELPSLESLTIHEGRIDTGFLDSLIPSPETEEDIILPALSKLTLRHAQFSWDSVIRFVAFRAPRPREINRWQALHTLMAVECNPVIPLEKHHKEKLNSICLESGQAFRWVYNISPIN